MRWLITITSVNSAITASPSNRRSNNTTDISGQLGIDLTYDDDAATFVFTNDVTNGIYASITDIYFAQALDTVLDFGSVSATASLLGVVSFTSGANPNGPSGFNWGSPPASVVGYSTDSDSPDLVTLSTTPCRRSQGVGA